MELNISGNKVHNNSGYLISYPKLGLAISELSLTFTSNHLQPPASWAASSITLLLETTTEL